MTPLHQEKRNGDASAETGDADAGLGFTQVGNAVLANRSLSMGARFLYITLKSFMYGDKIECYPSMETLAGILGKTEKTVRGYRRELEDARLIEKVRCGQGFNNRYRLKTLPGKNYRSGTAETTGPDQEPITGEEYEGKEDKDNNPAEPSEEKSSEATTTEAKEQGDVSARPDPAEIASLFRESLIARDKPAGEEAVEVLMRELRNAGYDDDLPTAADLKRFGAQVRDDDSLYDDLEPLVAHLVAGWGERETRLDARDAYEEMISKDLRRKVAADAPRVDPDDFLDAVNRDENFLATMDEDLFQSIEEFFDEYDFDAFSRTRR